MADICRMKADSIFCGKHTAQEVSDWQSKPAGGAAVPTICDGCGAGQLPHPNVNHRAWTKDKGWTIWADFGETLHHFDAGEEKEK